MPTPDQLRSFAAQAEQDARDYDAWARRAEENAKRYRVMAQQARERAADHAASAAAESARINAEFADILGEAA